MKKPPVRKLLSSGDGSIKLYAKPYCQTGPRLRGYRGAAARPQAVRGLPDAREKWVSEDFPRARGRGVARDFRFDQFTTLIGWPARKADTLATVASMRRPRFRSGPRDVRSDQALLHSQERIVGLDRLAWRLRALRKGPPTVPGARKWVASSATQGRSVLRTNAAQ